jgi:hypothetical protein
VFICGVLTFICLVQHILRGPLLRPAGIDGEQFATIERALDERTIGHNPERLNLMKVSSSDHGSWIIYACLDDVQGVAAAHRNNAEC